MHRSISFIAVTATAVIASAAFAATPARAPSPDALSALLKRQTEEFARASQTGDKAVLAKYLDPEVVFTNETGATGTREDLLSGPAGPSGPVPKSEIVDWTLRAQGDVATATFTDVVTMDYFGHVVEARYRSTEVWKKRARGWTMIASDTAYVPRDPPSIQLAAAELDEYVGTYRLAPGLSISITRAGDGLVSSTNGGAPTPMAFEVRDVAFTVGGGNGRRLFLRGPTGRVVGYISSRNGTDLRFERVG